MNIDRDVAMKLWRDAYGTALWARDCFGTYIYRDDYGDYETTRIRPGGTGRRYHYGWDVDHIRPKSNFANELDADFWNNLQPLHHSNNQEKSDCYPYFKINGCQYQVVRDNHGGYGIVDSSGHRIDWKKDGKYYS